MKGLLTKIKAEINMLCLYIETYDMYRENGLAHKEAAQRASSFVKFARLVQKSFMDKPGIRVPITKGE